MKKGIFVIAFLMIFCTMTAKIKTVCDINSSQNTPLLFSSYLDSPNSQPYGNTYYYQKSVHRFALQPGSHFNLNDLDADIKLITWEKDYAELEVYKTSCNCPEELDNKEIVCYLENGLTISSCCNCPENSTIISLKLKIPHGVNLGRVSGKVGKIHQKQFLGGYSENMLCR